MNKVLMVKVKRTKKNIFSIDCKYPIVHSPDISVHVCLFAVLIFFYMPFIISIWLSRHLSVTPYLDWRGTGLSMISRKNNVRDDEKYPRG